MAFLTTPMTRVILQSTWRIEFRNYSDGSVSSIIYQLPYISMCVNLIG